MKFNTKFDMKEINKLIGRGSLKSSVHPLYDLNILNYTEAVQFKHKWTDTLLQCRSLIVDGKGNVKSRSLSKFFNLEQDKCYDKDLITDNYRTFDKADGSIGTLFYYSYDDVENSENEGEWIFYSKGSFQSDQAIIGRQILEENFPQYQKLDKTQSYVFEIIYQENKIVVDYSDIRTLLYISSFMVDGTEKLESNEMLNKGFDIVEEFTYDSSLNDLKNMNIDNKEGFVILFDSGLRLKLKFEDYLNLHRTVTNLTPKYILDLVKSDKTIDEIVEMIPDEFHSWFNKIMTKIQRYITDIKTECNTILDNYKEKSVKNLAISTEGHIYKHIIIAMFKEQEYMSKIYNCIDHKSLGTSVGFKGKNPERRPTNVFILIGPSGSGKSTWAYEYMRVRKNVVVVNRDSLRISLFSIKDSRDYYDYYERNTKLKEKLVHETYCNIISNAIENEYTIILDNTNLDMSCLKELEKDSNIIVKIFGKDLTTKELTSRCSDRINLVNKKTINQQLERFKSITYESVNQKIEEWKSIIKTTKMEQCETNEKCIVFDIDGTIALNLNGRSPFDMSRVGEDSPNQHIINILKLYKSNDYKIILCSGREESSRLTTNIWLKENNIEYDVMYMRKNKDSRKDFVIKEEFWNKIVEEYYIELMYDDRNQVVDHARKLGFKVCQVEEGNF